MPDKGAIYCKPKFGGMLIKLIQKNADQFQL